MTLVRLVLAVLMLLTIAPDSEAVAPEGVSRAVCRPGSLPETGLQGQVPLADRQSGRSTRGYRCNLELVGRYAGNGSSWVSPSMGRCAYLPQAFPASLTGPHPGVQVVDVRDPRRPVLATSLTSPAFLSNPWESLKANEARGLLAGVSGASLTGAAFFDVYDVRDCRAPRLLNSVAASDLGVPANVLGHEGAFAPDGRTYWATGGLAGVLTAIDVSDPALPRVLFSGSVGVLNHGLSLSADGRTMYLSTIEPQGLAIVDVSEVQDRRTAPTTQVVGTLTWADGGNGQHSVPVTWKGRPYLVFVDEMKAGAVRFIDIADVTKPRIVRRLKLQVHLEAARVAADVAGSKQFGYEAHYCSVDRPRDPTMLACGFFHSGVRVFDVRDPLRPAEIAYYNPPAQTGRGPELPGSEHAQGVVTGSPGGVGADLTADWCSSPPRFVGRDQLWVTCQDSGFLALRLTL